MTQKPKKTDGLEITDTEAGFAVFDPKNGKVHFLNNTGVIILEICDGNHSIDEVVGMIESSYSVTDVTKEEIRNYIENLYHENLLEENTEDL